MTNTIPTTDPDEKTTVECDAAHRVHFKTGHDIYTIMAHAPGITHERVVALDSGATVSGAELAAAVLACNGTVNLHDLFEIVQTSP
jgi:hypothetical protein